MVKKIIISLSTLLLVCCCLLATSFYYKHKEYTQASKEYENTILRLSDDILIYDALRLAKKSKVSEIDVKNIMELKIKSDFEKMVYLFSKYDLSENEYMRCVMTRKYRYFQSLQDFETKSDKPSTKQYLENFCSGDTNTKNWAKCATKDWKTARNDKSCRQE